MSTPYIFTLRQHDTAPAIQVKLYTSEQSQALLDLTDASARFEMVLVNDNSTKTIIVNGVADITDAPAGELEYQWEVGDTADVGTYEGRFVVTHSDGTVETFPADSYLEVRIRS